MPVINQKYAFVTDKGWQTSLSKRWPDAQGYSGYRLLVFAGSDLPKLEREYEKANFKYLNVKQTIENIELGNTGPFICNLEQAREVANHFTTPVEDEQNAV